MGEEIELDLGLGPRRADRERDLNLAPDGVENHQVTRRNGQLGEPFILGQLADLVLAVIANTLQPDSGQFRGRTRGEGLEQAGHHRQALGPAGGLGALRLVVVAMLNVEFVQSVQQGLAFAFQLGGAFAQQQGGDGGILVTGISPRQVAQRLFTPQQEPLCPFAINHLADVFESHQQVAKDSDLVLFGDHRDEWRGDQRLDEKAALAERPGPLAFPQHVIGQQGSHAVARENHVATSVVADRHPQPIGIRVAGQHQVGLGLAGRFDDWLVHLGALGIGQLLRHLGKLAVLSRLWSVERDPLKARLGQHPKHRSLAHPVQWRIDRRHLPGLREPTPVDRIDVILVEFLAHHFYLASGASFVQIGQRDLIGLIDTLDDSPVMRRQHLPPRRPVGLHPVVRRGIVRRRDHHPHIAPQVPHRKREFRSGAGPFEQEDLQARRRPGAGGQFGEFARAMPAVVRNDPTAPRGPPSPLQVLGDATGRLADRSGIHRRRAQLGHRSTATARAERQHLPVQ